MDSESQAIFDRLVKLNPEDLTSNDREFLYARRDYLNHTQEETFAKVLEAEAARIQALQDEQEAERKPVEPKVEKKSK